MIRPVWRRALDCPQKKNPDVVEVLHVTGQVAFVLEYLWDEHATANTVVDAYAARGFRTAGMQAILSRLRNGGYLEDLGWVDGGLLRGLTPAGEDLVRDIRDARAAGYVLPSDTDPRDDQRGNDYPAARRG